MVWYQLVFKSKTRTGIICPSLFVCILFLLWKYNDLFRSNKNEAFAYFNSTCKINETCKYDTFSTMHMVNENEIVVARDEVTGKDWTLGDIKCVLSSEGWLLQNETLAQDKMNEIYPALVLEPNEKYVQPSAKNRTNGRFLVFNRVPKCASSTFVGLFRALMKERNNHFRYYHSTNYCGQQLTMTKEKEFLHWLAAKKNEQYKYEYPFAMDRHFYFIDSKAYNIQKDLVPSWVNNVRDPIDRFVSQFNYLRTEKRWANQLQRPPKEWFEKDINNCILSGDPECQFNSELKILKEHQLTYFCGSSPECQIVGSKAALQKAKYNAENNFVVIGVQDDIETSLCVMDHYLPLFFKRALNIYRTLGLENVIQTENSTSLSERQLLSKKSLKFTKNETPNKQQVSEQARDILKKNMTLEYEFYEFVKLRLKVQSDFLKQKMFPRSWCFNRINNIDEHIILNNS